MEIKNFNFSGGQEFLMNYTQIANRELIVKRLKDIPHSFHNLEFKDSEASAIGDFANERDADMIALIQYKHTVMEKLTAEPVLKKIAFHTKMPLLLLQE